MACLLCTLIAQTGAAQVTIDGLTYTLDETSYTATVTANYETIYSGTVDIPSAVSYNSRVYTVTAIGDEAFYDYDQLTAVNMPGTVTSIGEDAFSECSSLKAITIPEGVTKIDRYTFYHCKALEAITIPSKVTSIENYAFCGCTSLTSVTIPDAVTSIGNAAFFNCGGLTSFTFTSPRKIKSIGSSVFYGCTGLWGFEATVAGTSATVSATKWNFQNAPYQISCEGKTLESSTPLQLSDLKAHTTYEATCNLNLGDLSVKLTSVSFTTDEGTGITEAAAEAVPVARYDCRATA